MPNPPEHLVAVDDDQYHKKNVGGALAILGALLSVLVITAPIGIPMTAGGIWLWYRYRDA